jgi:hypothetical protein
LRNPTMARRTGAVMERKACPACNHPERGVVERALEAAAWAA